MKIGTDGVLLGAWTSLENVKTILDVGTGTGLLAIMMAQRNNKSFIDAVEIDESAYFQAKENIENCPWNERIKLYHSSFQDFANNCNKRYDLIISNPPYYNNQYRPEAKARAIARHDDTLPLDMLISIGGKLLSDQGIISLILSAESFTQLSTLLEKENLYLNRLLNVKPTPEKPVKRILVAAGKNRSILDQATIVLEKGLRHHFTTEYIELTKEFYLAF